MQWETATAAEIDALDRDRTVVILPMGAVEQHGAHMPLGTDSLLAHKVSMAAAQTSGGVSVAVLPPPQYGFSPHHMAFAGTVTLSADTLMKLATDIVDSVVTQGFRRILIVNGHGGNGGVVDVLASTLGHRHYGKARIAALTYFRLARDEIAELRQSGEGGMGHAGEFETAMMLHVAPDLVHMEHAVTHYPDPGSAYLTTDLLGGSTVRTYQDFNDLSESGVLGDPALATAENGARFFAAVSDALARFIADFAGWPVERVGP
jgi:creatinine amidohydrolase